MGYSFRQLEQLAANAGFPPALQPTMAAIALAESDGNPQAVNRTDNGGRQSSYGLWQISTGTHTPPDPNWANPQVNANLAYQKYRTQGLGAWGTYTSGKYVIYLLNGASNPNGTQTLSAVTPAPSNGCAHSISLPGGVSICLDAGIQFAVRGGLVVLGVVLILAALLIFAAGNGEVRSVAADAAKTAALA